MEMAATIVIHDTLSQEKVREEQEGGRGENGGNKGGTRGERGDEDGGDRNRSSSVASSVPSRDSSRLMEPQTESNTISSHK